ncbi:MAG: 50S ribosomal protein L32 [Patescibacteria group bacterium]|nr:50S ribosomal protein L32 [Patescibacteria group bacterium]
MAAVPKRRISKARKNRRRTHDSLKLPALALCPKCKQKKLAHFRCPHCGHYGDLSKLITKTSPKPKKQTKKQ